MAEKRVFKLVHTQARRLAVEAVQTAPDGYCVTVSEPTRSLDQNAAQNHMDSLVRHRLLERNAVGKLRFARGAQ